MADIKHIPHDLESLRGHLITLTQFCGVIEDILEIESVVSPKFISITEISGILKISDLIFLENTLKRIGCVSIIHEGNFYYTINEVVWAFRKHFAQVLEA